MNQYTYLYKKLIYSFYNINKKSYFIIMKVGIVVYPGSNCDKDTLRYFTNATYIWHKNSKL